MTISKKSEKFWIGSVAMDFQRAAREVNDRNFSQAQVFLDHACGIAPKIETPLLKDQINNYLYRPIPTNKNSKKIAEDLLTVSDILITSM